MILQLMGYGVRTLADKVTTIEEGALELLTKIRSAQGAGEKETKRLEEAQQHRSGDT